MKAFYSYIFEKRKDTLKKLADHTIGDQNELFLRFTTHNPTLITNGVAGLNGSVKGIGFFPKKEYLEKKVDIFREAIKKENVNKVKFLFDEIYNKETELDLKILSTIELAKNHTYNNLINGDKKGTLVFFTPPVISYEVRGYIELFKKGYEFDFVNLLHDFYHGEATNWDNRVVYLFHIEEVFNNSATPDGYGKRVL